MTDAPRASSVAARAGERRDPEATRRALLDSAAALFPVRGFDGVSVEHVADRAGVNKALVSYHFGGKRGLYVAVLESAFSEMADRVAAVEARGGSVPTTLRRLLAAFESMTHERPDFPVLFLREALTAGIEPAVTPHLLRIMGVTRRLAERGVREGVFAPVDPLLFHLGLVGSLIFFFGTENARTQAAEEGRVPFRFPTGRQFLRHVEALTLRGLAPAPHRGRARSRKGARG